MHLHIVFIVVFLVHLCASADLSCSRPSVVRRYFFGRDGVVDARGMANATQLNEVAPVVVDGDGAHFTNDSYLVPDGGSDGAGLHLGDLDGFTVGRTIHLELSMDNLPLRSGSHTLYWFFTGESDAASVTSDARAYAVMSARPNGTTVVSMVDYLVGGQVTLVEHAIPNDQLAGRTLISFSLILKELTDADQYDAELALYVNGTRAKTFERADRTYFPLPGFLTLGRELPCTNCKPFFGTMHSVTVDTEPLDHEILSYDSWESCTSTAVPESPGTMTTTTATMMATTTTSGALVFTGGDLDSGGAVGLDEEESGGDEGTGLPLTLIVVLAVIAVLCLLSLGALLVWRSRRRQRTTAVANTTSSSPPSSSLGEPTLPRSRSSKRRRGVGTYAAVSASTLGPGDDYTTMPTVLGEEAGGGREGGYRSMPSAVGDSDYRPLPGGKEGQAGRTHEYGGVSGINSTTSTYTALTRPKEVTGEQAAYASGNLGEDR
jgi:hypothetical protein